MQLVCCLPGVMVIKIVPLYLRDFIGPLLIWIRLTPILTITSITTPFLGMIIVSSCLILIAIEVVTTRVLVHLNLKPCGFPTQVLKMLLGKLGSKIFLVMRVKRLEVT